MPGIWIFCQLVDGITSRLSLEETVVALYVTCTRARNIADRSFGLYHGNLDNSSVCVDRSLARSQNYLRQASNIICRIDYSH